MKYLGSINRILLGLTMLIPGLLKLFVMKPAAIIDMLSGLGFPAATAFAWILIIAEIASGVSILAQWQLKYAVVAPAIILFVAGFTAYWTNWPVLLVHIALASSYLVMGWKENK